jgi:L-fuculose-phosphate aldolase
MADLDRLRADIVEIGKRLYTRGYCASNDGNITIRFADDRILTTPKSVSKGYMTPDMMVVVDLDGKKIAGDREASSELLMHLEVYRQRPDVKSVVHAHPPLATGFAVAGVSLDRAVLAEVICTLGSIPIVDYATPSTPELPAAVRQYIKTHDGLLLANHGALTVGTDVYSAYYKMETVEHFAKIRRAPDFAGGSPEASGPSRDVRHRGTGAHLRGRRPPGRRDGGGGSDVPGGALPRRPWRAAGARPGQRRGVHGSRRRAIGGGWRRGNSVNIPRAGGAHRGSRRAAAVMLEAFNG